MLNKLERYQPRIVLLLYVVFIYLHFYFVKLFNLEIGLGEELFKVSHLLFFLYAIFVYREDLKCGFQKFVNRFFSNVFMVIVTYLALFLVVGIVSQMLSSNESNTKNVISVLTV